MRLFFYALGVACVAYIGAGLALFLMQDRMLLPPAPLAADLRTVPHPGESIAAWNAQGRYAGYLVEPSGATPRGTVIVYHGNEESAEDKLPLAQTFVHAGYRVVIAEYPGHGRRSGPRLMRAARTASRDTLAEVLSRWHDPVYLVGESLGAGMAAQAVRGNESAIAGVVLITPWDSLAAVAAERYPVFPVRWMLHDPFDSVAAVAQYQGPLVIVGAQQDATIPVAHARRFAAEHPKTDLVILQRANHDNWFDVMTQRDWTPVLAEMSTPTGTQAAANDLGQHALAAVPR